MSLRVYLGSDSDSDSECFGTFPKRLGSQDSDAKRINDTIEKITSRQFPESSPSTGTNSSGPSPFSLSVVTPSPSPSPGILVSAHSLFPIAPVENEQIVTIPFKAEEQGIVTVEYSDERDFIGECSRFFDKETYAIQLNDDLESKGMVIGALLGEGASGRAYLTKDGTHVIKVFNVKALQGSSTLPVTIEGGDINRSEYLAMTIQSNHPALVLPIGVYVYDKTTEEVSYISRKEIESITPDHVLIAQVSPFVDGSPIEKILPQRAVSSDILILGEQEPTERTISQEEAVNVTIQLAEVMIELHAKGVLHRDYNPGNLILDKNNELKIIDWGTAINMDQIHPKTPVGAISFQAPETLVRKPYDQRTDAFTIGALLYRMLIAKPRISSHFDAADYDPNEDENINGLSEDLQAVLKGSLNKDPDSRMQLDEVIGRLSSIKS